MQIDKRWIEACFDEWFQKAFLDEETDAWAFRKYIIEMVEAEVPYT